MNGTMDLENGIRGSIANKTGKFVDRPPDYISDGVYVQDRLYKKWG